MNRDLQSWQRLAEATRRSSSRPADEPRQIPWLPDLEPRVRAAFLRLLWRSIALWAVVIAATVLAFAVWNSLPAAASENAEPPTPKLPLPPLP